jgi:hypothetical protein
VEEYVRLSEPATHFARIPHDRYVYFMADFLAQQPGATRAAAIEAWHTLKTMNCPKTYRDWANAQRDSIRSSRSRTRRG